MSEAEAYLAAIAAGVRGPGAERLASELRDHVADAIAAEIASGSETEAAARAVLDRLGPVEAVLAAWESRVRRRRTDARRRAAFVAFAVAIASALGIVQHASGHRPPHTSCSVSREGTDRHPAATRTRHLGGHARTTSAC